VRLHRVAVIAAVVAVVVAVAVVVVGTATDPTPARRPVAGARCDGFDLPVGPPDGRGYYNAQPFGANTHLGDDWNGVGGGDTDLGDPVYAVAAGVVVEAIDHGGGWGNVVRIVHACDGVESLYAHLATIDVAAGATVRRGARIGTIGTAGGQYPAHLHLELRARSGMPLGGGYGTDTTGYLDPTAFITNHRPHGGVVAAP
jgi:murein DD-endopeptidase MepM/ murein hydrolase activator NlpD